MAGRPDIAQKIICGIGNRMWNPWNLAFHDAIFFFDNDNPRFMGDYQYRMFWPAMTKAVSLLEEKEGQGKIFGLFEGVRGVFVLVMWLGLMQVFERMGGIRAVILALAILSIICGVVSFFFMADNTGQGTSSDTSVVKDMLTALKTPSAWLVAGVIFTIYAAYSSSSYMQAYGQNILGMSAVAAGYVGILRKDVIRLVAAPLSGFISEKIGGKCTLLIGIFDIIFIASLIALLGIPVGVEYTIITVVIMVVSSFAIYGMRGMYYAIIGEIGTPKKIYGAVAGFAMFIGFLPGRIQLYTVRALAGCIRGSVGIPLHIYLYALNHYRLPYTGRDIASLYKEE